MIFVVVVESEKPAVGKDLTRGIWLEPPVLSTEPLNNRLSSQSSTRAHKNGRLE